MASGVSRPGAPWDRDLRFAFNAARRYRGWRSFEPPYTLYGYRITQARTALPFGRSRHASAYLTHVLDALYPRWRGGRLVGAQARRRCGGRTAHFELLNEPASTVCPACTITRTERPSA